MRDGQLVDDKELEYAWFCDLDAEVTYIDDLVNMLDWVAEDVIKPTPHEQRLMLQLADAMRVRKKRLYAHGGPIQRYEQFAGKKFDEIRKAMEKQFSRTSN